MSERPNLARRAKRRVMMVPRDVGYGYGPGLMSALRKLWVHLRHPHCQIQFGQGCYLGPGFSLHMPEEATFIAGDDVEFRRNFRAELGAGARIEIGSSTRFTYDVVIQCAELVSIGERCMFGQSTLVVDGNHRFRGLDRPMLDQGYDLNPAVMEDDAVLTTKCTLIGARVGTRTYVGANSVVTSDLPPYCAAAGAPARVLDSFAPEASTPPPSR